MVSRSTLAALLSLITAASLNLSTTAYASAMGLDCNQAGSEIEQTICLDPKLLSTDSELEKQTIEMMEALSPTGKSVFTGNIVAALKRRALCKSDKRCLAIWYTARKTELQIARSFSPYFAITQSVEISIKGDEPDESISAMLSWPYLDGPDKTAVTFANDALTKICGRPPPPEAFDDRVQFKECTLKYINGKVLSFEYMDGFSPSASFPHANYNYADFTLKSSTHSIDTDDLDRNLVTTEDIFRDDVDWRKAVVDACQDYGAESPFDEASIPPIGSWIFDIVGVHIPCGEARDNWPQPKVDVPWSDIKLFLRPDSLAP